MKCQLPDCRRYLPLSHPRPAPRTYPTCRKEVEFGNGKVLLSKIGDKVHATSAYCTHYGAPLAKGVLVADGRVVWFVDPIASPVYTQKLIPDQPMARRYTLHRASKIQLTHDGHAQRASTFVPEISKTLRRRRPYTRSKLAFQMERSLSPLTKNVFRKRTYRASPRSPPIQTLG